MASTEDAPSSGDESVHKSFFNDKQYSDVIVKFGDHQLYAHRVILASESVYFERAFLGHFPVASSPVIDLGDDDDPDLVRKMVEYIYNCPKLSRRVPECQDDAPVLDFLIHLFSLADKYDIWRLRYDVRNAFEERARAELLAMPLDPGHKSDFVKCVLHICGPHAVSCADKALRETILSLCDCSLNILVHNTEFLDKYIGGRLLDAEATRSLGLRISYQLFQSWGVDTPDLEIYLGLRTLSFSSRRKQPCFFNNESFSDIEIRLRNNETVFAHKVVLAARSIYFRDILTKDPELVMIDVCDDDAELIKTMLLDIYNTSESDNWPDKKDWVAFHLDMHLLGVKYKVEDIKSTHQDWLLDYLWDGSYSDEFTEWISRVCGPSSKLLEMDIAEKFFDQCMVHIRRHLIENKSFVEKLREGELFDAKFAGRLTWEMGTRWLESME